MSGSPTTPNPEPKSSPGTPQSPNTPPEEDTDLVKELPPDIERRSGDEN